MQPLNCASLLLLLCVLLAALSPFPATAHRELLMATINGGRGDDGQAELVRAAAAAKDAEERVMRKRKEETASRCRFRTRKLPSSNGKNRFDGRMPFTADYHSVHRHPPKHN